MWRVKDKSPVMARSELGLRATACPESSVGKRSPLEQSETASSLRSQQTLTLAAYPEFIEGGQGRSNWLETASQSWLSKMTRAECIGEWASSTTCTL